MALMVREFSRNKAADSLELRAKINEPKKISSQFTFNFVFTGKTLLVEKLNFDDSNYKNNSPCFFKFSDQNFADGIGILQEFFRNFRLKKQLVSNFKLFYG